MRVKTFIGTDPDAVDEQVNEWLAENSGVKVCKTSTALQRLRDHGNDAITGKATRRRALGIAISVWYEEPYGEKLKPSSSKWEFN
jgi:hypothetical protein